jgi:hypothetical protein
VLPDGIFSNRKSQFFQTENPNLDKFGRVLQWKELVYFIAIWPILQHFGKFCGHLVHFMVFLGFFTRFGLLYEEKSGNPGWATQTCRWKANN